MSKKQETGFTLIEIAIVLLIISLLLGGIIKGQEMINSARVRSIANDLAGIEAAWISFQDRYRSLPGDFDKAATHIDADATDGDANARVDSPEEAGAVWQHLAASGFISGNFSGEAAGALDDISCSAEVCPSNPFNGFYKISSEFSGIADAGGGHLLSTGGNIPVAVIYELDLKIDDGVAATGRMRAVGDNAGECALNDEWNVVGDSNDCAAVWIF